MNEANIKFFIEHFDSIYFVLGCAVWIALVIIFKQKRSIKRFTDLLDRSRLDNREFLDKANTYLYKDIAKIIEEELIYKDGKK